MSYFVDGLNLALNKNGVPKPCISNAFEIFNNHPDWKGTLKFDEFSLRVIKTDDFPLGTPGIWSDLDCTKAMIWLYNNYGFSLSESSTSRVIDLVADKNRFHPVVEYLKSLEWDGVCRVGTWLEDYYGSPQHPATSIFQPVSLVGAVSRVIEPGSKNDYVLVLEGRQGIGKSSGICALFGHDWFSDAPLDFGGKIVDSYLGMRGKWCIEIAELDRFKTANMSKVKAFFSQITDAYRAPYGRNVIDVPRQCVFVGTVNSSAYLTDPTGNRRFMPVKATFVDVDGLANVRDQLWAEAYHLYRQYKEDGVPWWFSSDNPDVLSVQESRYETDPWEDIIQQYVESLPPVIDRIHSEELYSALDIEIRTLRRADFSRIRDAMERLGWSSARPYIEGVQRRGFVKNEPDSSYDMFSPTDIVEGVGDIF